MRQAMRIFVIRDLRFVAIYKNFLFNGIDPSPHTAHDILFKYIHRTQFSERRPENVLKTSLRELCVSVRFYHISFSFT